MCMILLFVYHWNDSLCLLYYVSHGDRDLSLLCIINLQIELYD